MERGQENSNLHNRYRKDQGLRCATFKVLLWKLLCFFSSSNAGRGGGGSSWHTTLISFSYFSVASVSKYRREIVTVTHCAPRFYLAFCKHELLFTLYFFSLFYKTEIKTGNFAIFERRRTEGRPSIWRFWVRCKRSSLLGFRLCLCNILEACRPQTPNRV